MKPSTFFAWRLEPVIDVDPVLAKKRPTFGRQRVLYSCRTGRPVAAIRRIPPGEGWVPKPYRVGWLNRGNEAQSKGFHTADGARRFINQEVAAGRVKS